MSFSQAIALFVKQTLAEASPPAALEHKVFSEVVPDSVKTPYALTMFVAGDAQGNVQGRTDVAEVEVEVVCVDQGASFANVEPMYNFVEKTLPGAVGTVPGYRIIETIFLRPVRRARVEKGVQYVHTGGVYRVRVQEE